MKQRYVTRTSGSGSGAARGAPDEAERVTVARRRQILDAAFGKRNSGPVSASGLIADIAALLERPDGGARAGTM